MIYLCLARKWRPKNFTDLIGQNTIVSTLMRALETKRLAHAFLFTGNHGVGKTTVARILAKSLSCEKGISSNSCNACTQCIEIWNGNSIDTVEIDGASSTGVDDIRELRDNVRYFPSNSRFRIFIIDEVHMLSMNAFNALLKTLEEPPAHVKFILATTEAHKIPITILSRCQRYDFKRVKFPTILKHLEFISNKEEFDITLDGLALIAENSNGSVRDALSLLDQVTNFSEGKITAQNVIEVLGIVDYDILFNLTTSLLKGDIDQALKISNKAILTGADYKKLLDSIALQFRHFCVSRIIGSAAEVSDLNKEQSLKIDQIAKKYNISELQQFLTIAIEASDNIRATDNPRLVLELAFLKMTDNSRLTQMDEINNAILRLESLSRFKQNLPERDEAILNETIKDNSDNWQEFVQAIREEMPIIACHLEHARFNPRGIFEFDQRLHFLRIQEILKVDSFRLLCKKYLNLIPDIVLSESIYSQRKTKAKIEQEEIEAVAHSDPTIQKALSMFEGQIKTVLKN